MWEEWVGTILHELKQGTEENSYWRQKRNTKIGNPFSDKHELYVQGSTCKFEEIVWKIIKLRANDWGVKPDGASALVWGTDETPSPPKCGLVHIYCFYIWAL